MKNLKELHLREIEQSDINYLKNIKFENLEILDLSNNEISDIEVLKNENFKGLKQFWLNS